MVCCSAFISDDLKQRTAANLTIYPTIIQILWPVSSVFEKNECFYQTFLLTKRPACAILNLIAVKGTTLLYLPFREGVWVCRCENACEQCYVRPSRSCLAETKVSRTVVAALWQSSGSMVNTAIRVEPRAYARLCKKRRAFLFDRKVLPQWCAMCACHIRAAMLGYGAHRVSIREWHVPVRCKKIKTKTDKERYYDKGLFAGRRRFGTF